MVTESPPSARQMPIPVLVTIAADGYVEVYGMRDIDAHITIVPAMQSPRGELLAEEYVELAIPFRHRAIYLPGMIRAAKLGRAITPQEIAEIRSNIAMLRTVDTLCGITSGEATTCTL